MKHIVITRGVFGFVAAPGAPVIAKTPKDPPFPVEDKLAARLVAAKVAAYAEPVESTDADLDHDAGGTEYNEGMTRDELNKIAESYGVETPAKIKGGKAAVIEAIEAAKAAKENDGEDDEDDDNSGTGELPPAPGLAPPV